MSFRCRVLLPFAVVVATFAVGVTGALAGTTLVPNRFDDPSDGVHGVNCTVAPLDCSLRGAVQQALTDGNGDTIQLSTGTYSLGRLLSIDDSLAITGTGTTSSIIKQTEPLTGVISFLGASLALTGLELTGGAAHGSNGSGGPASGGALKYTGGSVTMTDVTVTDNSATGGTGSAGAVPVSGPGGAGGQGGMAAGGAINGTGPLTLLRVALIDNKAIAGDGGAGANGVGAGPDDGGAGGPPGAATGGAIAGPSPITITDSLLAGNIAQDGAGGTGGGGSPGGGAGGVGGGLVSGGFGGAIYASQAATLVDLTNVTLTGNLADPSTGGTGGVGGPHANGGSGGIATGGEGGALAVIFGAQLRLDSVTVAANTAAVSAASAGGTAGAGPGGTPGASGSAFPAFGNDITVGGSNQVGGLDLRDTIIAGGASQSAMTANCYTGIGAQAAIVVSHGHNIDDGTTCIPAPGPGDQVNTPAGLAALADNGGPTQTMALLPGSAAIAAGASPCVALDGVTPLATDQRGLPRATPCDVGAFQLTPPAVPPPVLPPSPPPPSSPLPAPPLPPKPHKVILELTKLKIPSHVRRGHRLHIAVSLNTAGRVTFRLWREVAGTKVAKKCVAPSSKHKRGHVCLRLIPISGGPAALNGRKGANSVNWTAPRSLALGGYELSVTPKGGTPATQTLIVDH